MKNKFKQTEIGMIPEDWETHLLKDVCEKSGIQTGPFGSQLHKKDYVIGGTPIVTVEHLGENHLIYENLPCVSESDKRRLAKYMLRKGDIVFSRVGSVDRRALVKDEEEGWLFSGRCLRVRPNKTLIDSAFLSYFFGLSSFRERIKAVAVGATMPSLNTTILSEVNVICPPIEEQKKIAKILSDLDSKIELNQQMNKTLEAIGQALFKQWFVDFEFPNEEGKPYKSSGGEMVYSEELGKEIPKGWVVKRIGEILELAYGKALKAEDRCNGNIPVFGSNGQVGWHNEWLVKGPGIVIGRKGNPGIVKWASTDFFPIDTTFYVIPKDKSYSLHFLFHVLKGHDLASLGADSAVPGLNRNAAYMSIQIMPPLPLQIKYDLAAKKLSDQMYRNEEESRILANLRDSLLPKLMSGKIRVII